MDENNKIILAKLIKSISDKCSDFANENDGNISLEEVMNITGNFISGSIEEVKGEIDES